MHSVESIFWAAPAPHVRGESGNGQRIIRTWPLDALDLKVLGRSFRRGELQAEQFDSLEDRRTSAGGWRRHAPLPSNARKRIVCVTRCSLVGCIFEREGES